MQALQASEVERLSSEGSYWHAARFRGVLAVADGMLAASSCTKCVHFQVLSVTPFFLIILWLSQVTDRLADL